MPSISRLLAYLATFVALGLAFIWLINDRFQLLVWAGYSASLALIFFIIYRAQHPSLNRNAAKMISEINHIPIQSAEAQEWDVIYVRLSYFLTSPVPEVRRAALNRLLTALWTEDKLGISNRGLASKSAAERLPQILNGLILRVRPKSLPSRIANVLSKLPFTSSWVSRRDRLHQELRFVAHRSLVSSNKPFRLMFMRWMAEYRATRIGKVISDKFMLEMQLLFGLTNSEPADMENSLAMLLNERDVHLRATAAAKIPTWYIQAAQQPNLDPPLKRNFEEWMQHIADSELKRPGIAGPFLHATRQNRVAIEEVTGKLDLMAWVDELKEKHPGKEPQNLEHYPALLR